MDFQKVICHCFRRDRAGTILRHQPFICQPTVSPTSLEATILSASVSSQASEFLGQEARGNIWLAMASL